MIDLHCHILPGVDDGPPDLEAALALARAHVEAGVHTVAATSHIELDMGPEPLEVAGRVADLQRALDEHAIPLRVVAGGELAMPRAVGLREEELDALRLGGGPWILLECPLSPAVGDVEPLIFSLRSRGYEILLAHPERSPFFLRAPERLERLVGQGIATQVTAGAVRGRFGETVRRYAAGLVRDGLATVIASDAHDLERRPPGLAVAFGEREDALRDHLCDVAPAAILRGEPVPPAPAAPRGGLLDRLRGASWRR